MIFKKNNFIFALSVLPMIFYIIGGMAVGYYLYFFLIIFIIFFYLINYSKKEYPDFVLSSILIIIVSSIVLGGINAILGINDFKNYFSYTLMGVGYISAILLGLFLSDKRDIAVKILFVLGMSELLLVIPRIFVVGFDSRTSMGFTFLIPYLFLFIRFNFFYFLFFIFISFLFLGATLFSGLRSVLFSGFVLYFYNIFKLNLYFDKSSKKISKNNKKYYFIYPLIILFLVVFSFNILNLRDRIENSTNIVITRMEQTLLNSDGVRLDPKEGRSEEAEIALVKFREHAYLINYLIGMGYGFSFNDDSKDGEGSAHVHITPVAFFLRHGVLGIVLYFLLIYGMLKIFISKNVSKQEKLSLFLWLSSSLFYGALILPTFWFFWAYLYASSKK